jgi:hypothetical protein
VDVKAGKKIRVDAEGFENFSDYFTSPEVTHGIYYVILAA